MERVPAAASMRLDATSGAQKANAIRVTDVTSCMKSLCAALMLVDLLIRRTGGFVAISSPEAHARMEMHALLLHYVRALLETQTAS